MRWRELVSRKATRVRVTTKAWPSEPDGELASMDDLATTVEARRVAFADATRFPRLRRMLLVYRFVCFTGGQSCKD